MSATEDWIQFYPELRASGSLCAALTAALTSIGSSLVATDSPDYWFPKVYARVKAKPRFVQVYVASTERLFLPDFWLHGVCMAAGNCADLGKVASAIHQWITDRELPITTLSKTFPWVALKDGATAFEEGRAVDWKWDRLIHDDDRLPDGRSLINRAAVEPRLRMLFPYTSMHILCFSRCTGYPFTRDTPYITPLGHGQYQVCVDDRELGHGDADFAVRLTVEHLPPHCGPAWTGTAEDEDSFKAR